MTKTMGHALEVARGIGMMAVVLGTMIALIYPVLAAAGYLG